MSPRSSGVPLDRPGGRSAETINDLKKLIDQLGRLILGKRRQLRLALACLLAKGHLLIEDLPGMGKTTLARGLANVLGLEFSRIQFTSDLLPADIIGVSIYQPETRTFQFHPGPVFSQLVLADEINRATPKAQSALLEAMAECQVSVEGETHPLPEPFFVIATQNPHQLVGTYPLPESQLDRFTMQLSLGYPDREAERQLLKTRNREDLIPALQAGLGRERLLALQGQAAGIHVSDALLDYVQDLVDATRRTGDFTVGLSPRAALSLLACARAWALIEGRSMVLPEDVQAVAIGVMGHRLQATGQASDQQGSRRVQQLIESVPIP